MRASLQLDEIEKRRDNNLNRFCKDLMNTLFYAKSSQDVVTWIDDISLKLKKFIKQQTRIDNNKTFQAQMFIDICTFLNALNGNFRVRKFHNSISKTPIEEYKNMSLWEQFFNNAYEENREFDYDCKWWSCTNWTLSLYNFFNALKEAWLDIKISIYRLKNTGDNFVWVASMRHAWLVINFQWVDYMIDYEGINDVFSWCLIQSVDRLKSEIQKFWIKDVHNLDALKIQNWEKNNSRDNDQMLIHFDNLEDFLDDVKKYPELKKISFITTKLKNWEPTRLDYEFFNWWVYIEVDEYQRIFFLKKDAVLEKDKTKFLKSLSENIDWVQDEYWEKKFTQADKEELDMLLWMVENDINLDYVMSEYDYEDKESLSEKY